MAYSETRLKRALVRTNRFLSKIRQLAILDSYKEEKWLLVITGFHFKWALWAGGLLVHHDFCKSKVLQSSSVLTCFQHCKKIKISCMYFP